MSSWWRFEHYMNRGKVGELNVKTTSHWEKVERQYWSSTCGLDIRPENVYGDYTRLAMWDIPKAMVRLQHALVNAVGEDDEVLDKVVLKGELYHEYYNNNNTSFMIPCLNVCGKLSIINIFKNV